MTEDLKNEIPSIDIRIDKDGVWYYKGNEMIRKDILELFFQSLDIDQQGRYLIKKDQETFYIEVEDVPFTVISIEPASNEKEGAMSFNILLSDQSVEKLDPTTLRQGEENVLYCSIKNKRFEARFTRKSYYQLAEYIQYDRESDRYFITINDSRYNISSK